MTSPASSVPPIGTPAGFYRADALNAADSLGLLCKRVMQSLALQIDRQLQPHDLTHAQWLPLYKLSRGECHTIASLARDQALDPGAMTRALDRLEAKGLVRRVRSRQDRRVVDLEITDEGRRLAQVVPAVLADVFNAHLAGFTDAEWRQLVTLLQRMVANGDALRETVKDAAAT